MALVVLHLLSTCTAALPTVIAAHHENAAVGIPFLHIKCGRVKIDMCLERKMFLRNCVKLI
jgi:hypothetical protein